MASRIRSRRGKGRPPARVRNTSEIDLEDVRDAEIRRREYKTPAEIAKETEYVYGNDVYTVSKILAKRVCNGRKEYLIKWHGYSKSQSTWEPATNILDQSVIKKFEAKNSLLINVSHEQVQKASSEQDDVSEEGDDEEPARKRRRQKQGRRSRRQQEKSRSTQNSHSEERRRQKGRRHADEEEHKPRHDTRDRKTSNLKVLKLTSEKEEIRERPTTGESISRDGDTSGEEIAEEPLSDKEIIQWDTKDSFDLEQNESVDKESDSSGSSNFNEIQDIVNMMTERVAMEIEGVQDAMLVGCIGNPSIDENNNEDSKEAPEVSHSIDIPPSDTSDDDDLMQAEAPEGLILGSAVRSGIRVYLVKWSSGARQVVPETDVKEKWPQLLIKFYESNIHWLKRLN